MCGAGSPRSAWPRPHRSRNQRRSSFPGPPRPWPFPFESIFYRESTLWQWRPPACAGVLLAIGRRPAIVHAGKMPAHAGKITPRHRALPFRQSGQASALKASWRRRGASGSSSERMPCRQAFDGGTRHPRDGLWNARTAASWRWSGRRAKARALARRPESRPRSPRGFASTPDEWPAAHRGRGAHRWECG